MKLEMHEEKTPGKLITFCGLDGCGKTTLIKRLSQALEKSGRRVYLTKQPTDFVRKNELFRAFMDLPRQEGYDYRALSLLCASDRVFHTTGTILPKLRAGDIVLSDRYFYSCLANLIARGYQQDRWIYEIARQIRKPDIAFFLDVSVETAVARVRARKEEKDRYIDLDLQYRLREQYNKIAAENGGVLIDTAKTEEESFSRILSEVSHIV